MLDATVFLREKKHAGTAGCDPLGELHHELLPSRSGGGTLEQKERSVFSGDRGGGRAAAAPELRHPCVSPLLSLTEQRVGDTGMSRPRRGLRKRSCRKPPAGKPASTYIL